MPENNFFKVTVKLNSIAVYDNFTPNLDALLIYQYCLIHDIKDEKIIIPSQWRDRIGLDVFSYTLSGQPEVEVIAPEFFCVSSPQYTYVKEEKLYYRKRWDYQEFYIDWQEKRAKVDTSCGHTKSYNLPLFTRILSEEGITWYGQGDLNIVAPLLKNVGYLGKKRSQGKGLVSSWEFEEIAGSPDQPPWLLTSSNTLNRVIPLNALKSVEASFKGITLDKCLINTFVPTPPYYEHERAILHFCPGANVKKIIPLRGDG